MAVDLDTNDVVYYAGITSAQNTATMFAVISSDVTTAGRPSVAYQGGPGEIAFGIPTTTSRWGAGWYGPGAQPEIEDDTNLVTGRFYRQCMRGVCGWPSASSQEFDLYDPVADRSFNGSSSQDVDQPDSTDMNIGAVWVGNWTTYNWDGKIAEVALWPGVLLTDPEVASLMAGVSPLFVRPAALGFYHPLTWLGRDLISGTNYGTNATPTIVDEHPAIINPGVPHMSTAVIAAAAGGSLPPFRGHRDRYMSLLEL